MDDDRNPEYPDPTPNESTVIAKVINNQPKTTSEGDEPPPMTEWQRRDLEDEIELDML